jgi:hypothetical protein
MGMLALGAPATGCSSQCESPVQVLCCVGGCNGDTTTPAICTPQGLACPEGSAPLGQCGPDVHQCGGRDGGG